MTSHVEVNFYDAGYDGEMATTFPESIIEEYDVDIDDHDAAVYLPEFIVEVNFYYAVSCGLSSLNVGLS